MFHDSLADLYCTHPLTLSNCLPQKLWLISMPESEEKCSLTVIEMNMQRFSVFARRDWPIGLLLLSTQNDSKLRCFKGSMSSFSKRKRFYKKCNAASSFVCFSVISRIKSDQFSKFHYRSMCDNEKPWFGYCQLVLLRILFNILFSFDSFFFTFCANICKNSNSNPSYFLALKRDHNSEQTRFITK